MEEACVGEAEITPQGEMSNEVGSLTWMIPTVESGRDEWAGRIPGAQVAHRQLCDAVTSSDSDSILV